MSRLLEGLAAPRALWLLALAAGILFSPLLVVGFQLDDVIQQGLLAEPGTNPVDLFRYARSPGDLAARQRQGIAPWWADPELRLAFLRPLATWTHALDHRVAGTFHPWHALHSAAWYLLACAAALAVYRRTLAGGATILALALFALDDAHATTVGWLANRNAVIAAAFGFSAVAAHLRERRLLAAGLLGLSLLSSEAGVATLGYLAAATLFLDRERWRSAIYLLPTALWAWLWIDGGHGARHSDLYLDPVGSTGPFLRQAARHVPLLFASQWTLSWCDLAAVLAPASALSLARASLGAVALVGWLAWPALRSDRHARFLFAGSALALVPVSATLPTSRLLLFAGLGAAGLLATLADRPSDPLRRAALAGLVALQLGSAALIPVQILSVRVLGGASAEVWDGALRDPEVEGTTAVALQAPVALFAGHLPWQRRLRGEPGPAALHPIGPSFQRSVLRRLDERTLRLEVDRGFHPPVGSVPELPAHGLHLVAQALDRALTDGCPRRPGESVDLGPLEVRVVDVLPDGRPAAVELRFDAPLEDPSLRLVVFRGGRAADFAPPPVGGTVILPANPLLPEG